MFDMKLPKCWNVYEKMNHKFVRNKSHVTSPMVDDCEDKRHVCV